MLATLLSNRKLTPFGEGSSAISAFRGKIFEHLAFVIHDAPQ